jgi:hypothetical protein
MRNQEISYDSTPFHLDARPKAEAWPLSLAVPHWRAEARGHRDNARRRFSPAMAQRIDVTKLYREALHRMPETMAIRSRSLASPGKVGCRRVA